MEIEHLILASGSSIDQERNSLSVFELLEDFHIQTNAPGIQVPFQLVVVLKREPAETGESKQQFRFQLFGPDGASLFDQEFPANLPHDQRRYRVRANLPLPIGRSGMFRFVVSRKDRPDVMRETDILVKLHKGEPGQGGPPGAPGLDRN